MPGEVSEGLGQVWGGAWTEFPEDERKDWQIMVVEEEGSLSV